jgi:cytochrome P450
MASLRTWWGVDVAEQRSLLGLSNREALAFYDEIRNWGGPAFWDPEIKSWLFADYDRVVHISKHEEAFKKAWGDTPGGVEFWGARSIQTLPPDQHWQFHRRLAACVREIVEDDEYTERYLRPLIHRLIDPFAGRGYVDFNEEFADRLPLMAIMDLFGLPADLYDECKRFNEGMAAWLLAAQSGLGRPGETEPTPDERQRFEAAMAEAREALGFLREVLMPVIEHRRDRPGNDLVSKVWEAGRAVVDDWNEDDVLGNCNFLFGAGNRTTARAFSNAMYVLTTHPGLYERVLHDDGAMERFIEEALRLYPSPQMGVRIATEDVELGEACVAAGDSVHVLRVAANRDPQRFACPAEVDIDREGVRAHLAFGIGRRSCIGAPLARHELQEGFRILLKRLPNLRLDSSRPQPEYVGLAQPVYTPIHLRFDPQPV